MHAISLSQPYASLMAIKAKRWETRGFRISQKHGELAICACAVIAPEYRPMLQHKDFRTALETAGLDPDKLPLGAVVAIGKAEEAMSTREWIRRHCRQGTQMNYRDEREYLFGDYSPGRFASFFPNVRALRTPVPCRGMQGLWPVAPDLEAKIREQLDL